MAGIGQLPYPQGLILSKLDRRMKEAINYKTWLETVYTNATAFWDFGNVVQAAELLGHLPSTFTPFLYKVFTDKERARAQRNKPPKAMAEESAPNSRPAGTDPAHHGTALLQSRLTQHCHSCRQNDSLGNKDLLQPLLRLVRVY